LDAKSKQGGATIAECIHHIEVEITDMGATKKRARAYIKSCDEAGLIYTHGLKFKVSKDGQNWLERKV
jgi:hypothetical protein